MTNETQIVSQTVSSELQDAEKPHLEIGVTGFEPATSWSRSINRQSESERQQGGTASESTKTEVGLVPLGSESGKSGQLMGHGPQDHGPSLSRFPIAPNSQSFRHGARLGCGLFDELVIDNFAGAGGAS